MYMGKKNGKIVAFNATPEDLQVNAMVKGITLDSVEETDESIVPYHNTPNDGVYYKQSELPPMPTDLSNTITRNRRRELYLLMSDPITNNISFLRDRIITKDFETEEERQKIEENIAELCQERKAIRAQIVADNPLPK